MSKFNKFNKFNKGKAKEPSQRYVVQTYCGWTEPQYETVIANNEEEINDIAINVDSIEAIYKLGEEVKLTSPKLVSLA